jgi:aspartate racemase
MEEDFYKKRLANFGLEVIVPAEREREKVNTIIFQELCQGKIKAESRKTYQEIMANLVKRGAEGIILGCTEIGLLVKEGDAEVPLFDTTYLHALKAVKLALEEEKTVK